MFVLQKAQDQYVFPYNFLILETVALDWFYIFYDLNFLNYSNLLIFYSYSKISGVDSPS